MNALLALPFTIVCGAVALAPVAARAEGPDLGARAVRVEGLTLADCVARALERNGQVAELQGKVREWEAKAAEARSVYYPKLTATAFGAPIYAVKGDQRTLDVHRDWSDWGPYLRFDGLLTQPLSTFGRAEAGEDAARERAAVEQGALELARQKVALDVRRYWLLHLYARSLQPLLDSTAKTLGEARAKAKELQAEDAASVSLVDLMRLEVGWAELEKYRVQAEIGAGLSLAALKQAMGLPPEAPLVLADAVLPAVPPEPLPPLEELVRLARERRPEAAQLAHGRRAAESLARAEAKADLPVMALVGQLQASWTPNRTDAENPYANDPWNDLYGGVALAFRFDLDPARSHARAEGARSLAAQVEGLARVAATGIPVEVRKARDEADQAARLVAIADQGSAAAKRWMVYASTAYATGTGETKDLLEGVAAYAQTRKGYLDALLAYHTARAQLDLATGAPPGR
ncbi:MAG: TolC family protein [Anaeromyxobacteraceae bacterium]